MPMEQEVMQEAPMEQEETQVDPQLEKEAGAYITGLMKMLHSKDTTGTVMEMLKGGEPEETIPQVALLINWQMEAGAKQGGKPPSLEVLLNAGIFLTQDLIEMGNAAGIFEIVGEQESAPYIQATIQAYIEKGLKDKTIDPVELQEKVEPLMDELQRGEGMAAGAAAGLPEKPDQMTAMEQYATKREQKAGMMKGGQ